MLMITEESGRTRPARRWEACYDCFNDFIMNNSSDVDTDSIVVNSSNHSLASITSIIIAGISHIPLTIATTAILTIAATTFMKGEKR